MPDRFIHRSCHRSAHAAWDVITATPAPALAGAVRGYQGYHEASPAPVRRAEMPTTDVVLIINLGAPWLIESAGGPAAAHDSFVAGLDEGPSFVAATGEARCLQVDFTPIGACRFFGMPLAGLAGRVTSLEAVLGSAAWRLVERLAAAPDWEARFDLLDAVILDRFARHPPPNPAVEHSWARLAATGGALPIASLAAEIGWSRTHLARHFRTQFGLSPKAAARVLRFGRVINGIEAAAGGGAPGSGPQSWADLALACGYCDQSHLNREVRALSGYTPTELARRLVADGSILAG